MNGKVFWKRGLLLLMSLLVVLTVTATPAFALNPQPLPPSPPVDNNQIMMHFHIGSTDSDINGQAQPLDTAPIISKGRTFLPIKFVAGPLGAKTSWDPSQKMVTVTLGNTTIQLWIGKNTATVNGIATPIDPGNPDVTPVIMKGRTLLPLAFIAKNLGCQVNWNAFTHEVTVAWLGKEPGSLFGSPLTYNGNGSTGGSVPIDSNSPYTNGATVTVLGNTGNLVETGRSFAGWNTAADGSGTSYQPGSIFKMGTAGVTLYALWSPWLDFSSTGFWTFPWGMAVDSAGNIYVADVAAVVNNDDLGVVEELASGSTSWTAITSPLAIRECFDPWDVAVDNLGNTYEAFKYYDKIIELTSGNAFTTDLTSNGGFNFPDGPQGIAVDSAGNVYVTDTGNNKIKELKKGSTSWKDITGSGGFNQPSGVAVDSAGNVYVADSGNNAIKELIKGNVFWTDITSNGGFSGSGQVYDFVDDSDQTYNGPQGVAVDSAGNVYVTDSGNNAIKELKKGSTSWTDITDNGGFSFPCGIAVDSSDNVYVADTNNCEIKELPATPGTN
jgi:hypothetical protein